MLPNIGINELLVIFLIVLLLFGAKRLPEIAKGLGRGIVDFKQALKQPEREDIHEKKDAGA
jgi:sec-independent protein translocase protein TatA